MGRGGLRIDVDPESAVLGRQGNHRVGGEVRRRGHIWEGPSVGPVEADISADRSPSSSGVLHDLDPEPLFVYGPVMTPAEKYQVIGPRLSAIGPVLDVMRVTEAQPAGGESTASVPVVERWRRSMTSSVRLAALYPIRSSTPMMVASP